MANPNKSIWNARHTKATHTVEIEISVPNAMRGDEIAQAVKALKVFSRVQASSYKIGPRSENRKQHVVRCYSTVTDDSWNVSVIYWRVS